MEDEDKGREDNDGRGMDYDNHDFGLGAMFLSILIPFGFDLLMSMRAIALEVKGHIFIKVLCLGWLEVPFVVDRCKKSKN